LRVAGQPIDDCRVEQATHTLRFGPVRLIPFERIVLKDGEPVTLTPKAFDLLAYMASHPGRLLSKDELLRAVWPDVTVEESNLSYNVFAIRRALGEDDDGKRYIETVPKRGYRFVPHVTVDDANHAISGGHPAEGAGVQAPPSIRPFPTPVWVFAILAVGVTLGALLTGALRRTTSSVSGASPLRFQEPVWGRLAESRIFSVSPDGQQIALATEGTDGVLRFWVRALSSLAPMPVPGSEQFAIAPPVIWSPDSGAMAITGIGGLRRINLSGGPSQPLCAMTVPAVGGSWNRDGVILTGNPTGGILQCPASGGTAAAVTHVDPQQPEGHLFPSFLPDGRHYLYLRIARANPERSGVYVSELGSAVEPGEPLIVTGFQATFVESVDDGPGVIVFARDGRLFGQRFDDENLTLRGAPTLLADRIGSYLDFAYFAASATTLVYRAPEPPSQLTWFNREGREIGRVGDPQHVAGLALAPSDDRVLVARHAPQSVVAQDLWLFDLTSPTPPRRLTFAPTLEFWPVWVGNHQFVFGAGGGPAGVYRQAIDGDRQLLFKPNGEGFPTSAVPTGDAFAFTTFRRPGEGADIWIWAAAGPLEGTPLVEREFDQTQAQLSPDGKWIAYVSNETGRNEVFLASFQFDRMKGRALAPEGVPVSNSGGVAPRWRADGRELFYLAADGWVISVRVDTRGAQPSTAERLFTVASAGTEWGVTRDGNRFLFAVPTESSKPLNVMTGWQKLVPR
jgi:DNA-binding winged helix-turn-helix (wHTH) protein/Tol biopolymer transport system component